MPRLMYVCLILVIATAVFAQQNTMDSTFKALNQRVEALSHKADSLQGQLDRHALRESYFTSE